MGARFPFLGMEDQLTNHHRFRGILEATASSIGTISIALLLLGFASLGAMIFVSPMMLLSDPEVLDSLRFKLSQLKLEGIHQIVESS